MSEQKNIVKLRLEGLPENIVKFEDLLLNSELAKVLQSSKFYSNRYSSAYSRKYLEVEFMERKEQLKIVSKGNCKDIYVAYKRADFNMALLLDLDDELSNYYNLLECETIDIVRLPNRSDIAIILDDAGKLNGKMPNILYGNDVIVGDVVFAGVEDEELCGLNDEQIEIVTNYIKQYSCGGANEDN